MSTTLSGTKRPSVERPVARPGYGQRREQLRDRTRPVARMRQPAAPGGRPAVLGAPVRLGVPVSFASAAKAAPTVKRASATTGQWHLTERGLAVLVIAFLLVMVLGAAVVVNQYLALGGADAASTAGAAQPVAAVALK